MAKNVYDQWVLEVLGFDVEEHGNRQHAAQPVETLQALDAKDPSRTIARQSSADWGGKLAPIWTEAKAQVDQDFAALQRELKAVDDPDVQQLADFGLNGVTDRDSVRLMAALMDADNGRGTDKLVAAIDRFRSFLDGSPIVDLIEDNPFGVAIPLRAQLGSALDIIASKIAA